MSKKIQPESIHNMRGFEGDNHLQNMLTKIVKDNNVNTIIETGTFYGNTTKKLAALVPYVVTIDDHKYYHNKAKARFAQYGIDSHNLNKNRGVLSVLGKSEDKLASVIDNLPEQSHTILFYLDAIVDDQSALLTELRTISNKGLKPIIVISGFQVPGKIFATYRSAKNEYNIKAIREALTSIYGDDYQYHYNEFSAGSKKGTIFIYPKAAITALKPVAAKKKRKSTKKKDVDKDSGNLASD